MSQLNPKVNRRSFLKASAVAGGGMMLTFNWFTACAPTEEQVMQMPDNWYDINAFLKIGNNGVVTIMSPNPEIGQNVKTSMPMIVAEELDVDWENVIVEQAGYDITKYTRQLAGGSQSIRQGWTSLRTAGATARRMLVEAAAQQWQVSADEITTDAGVLKHGDKTMGYGEVAEAAGAIPVPESVELKDPKDFTIIGTSRKNVDGEKIVNGVPLYGIDTYREGMLTAMIVHPPAFGMKMKSMNADAVKQMPGIKDIFSFSTHREGEFIWSEVNAFEELIAVVGNTTWEVMQAKNALNVEWESTSPLESTADHIKGMEDLVNSNAEEPDRKDGDPDAAFASAAQVIERTYTAPFLAHNTMEPMNFFADVSADKAYLEGPIQTPEYMSQSLAGVLGLPEEKISIMMTRMGGGFGRRLYGHFGVEAAVISQKIGAPVKMLYTREDDMTQGTYRPAYRVSYKAGLDENNNVVAFQAKGAGIHGGPLFANRYPAGAVENYKCENFTLDSNISTGAWRAPRSNFVAGAEQSFLDEVAEVAGKDPIEFRLELFDRAINNPVGENNDYDAARYAGVLRLVREKSGWGNETPGISRGVSAYYCHNSYVAQVIDMEMKNGRPRVKKVWCAVDCGIVVNPIAATNQIEGGIVDGIGHAMFSEITFDGGQPRQSNFNNYRLIRTNEAPLEVETFFVENGIDPTGLGEPSLPPIMGALSNALAKATGKRFYNQPFVSESILPG